MLDAAVKAISQMFSPPFRAVLLKCVGLALVLIVLVGIALYRLLTWLATAGADWAEAMLGVSAHTPIRTPRINKDAGRDHWPSCYSAVLAGGGIRGGQVIGESDAIGGYPASLPLTPADLHATVLTALGYDPQRNTFTTGDGRPMPLSEGHVIKGLL